MQYCINIFVHKGLSLMGGVARAEGGALCKMK
nr:MAG TPA: hypothetical protein [Caudoviricetes sp.]